MAELLDLRRDLQAPLTNYRAAVAKMADRLTTKVYEPESPAELDDLWISDVELARVRMREELAQPGLVRELARKAAVGPDLLGRAARLDHHHTRPRAVPGGQSRSGTVSEGS
jgi:hypothetical protein